MISEQTHLHVKTRLLGRCQDKSLELADLGSSMRCRVPVAVLLGTEHIL